MGFKLFIRDNVNALSFNMLIVTMLDIVSFLCMFILVIPLPDVIRRGYAGLVSQAVIPFALFMMFCMYNMFSTVFKLLRNINDYHHGPMTNKKLEPQAFYKRIAKNQRDILLCIMGCIFSVVTLLLSVQMKNMTTDPKKEEEPEKDPVEKKEDLCVCLTKSGIIQLLVTAQQQHSHHNLDREGRKYIPFLKTQDSNHHPNPLLVPLKLEYLPHAVDLLLH